MDVLEPGLCTDVNDPERTSTIVAAAARRALSSRQPLPRRVLLIRSLIEVNRTRRYQPVSVAIDPTRASSQ